MAEVNYELYAEMPNGEDVTPRSSTTRQRHVAAGAWTPAWKWSTRHRQQRLQLVHHRHAAARERQYAFELYAKLGEDGNAVLVHSRRAGVRTDPRLGRQPYVAIEGDSTPGFEMAMFATATLYLGDADDPGIGAVTAEAARRRRQRAPARPTAGAAAAAAAAAAAGGGRRRRIDEHEGPRRRGRRRR